MSKPNPVEQLISMFNALHKDLTVTAIIDYTRDLYVVEAVRSTSEPDYSDPYYVIEKKTGRTSTFYPMTDLDNFIRAAETRTIYKRGD